jgi:hypothetical protein
LADAFERSGQLAQAARTLMGIPLETGQRFVIICVYKTQKTNLELIGQISK